ncbi:DsbA family protein [Shouchella hunanensis]|uniref:DsbA family protein n=1 Tax=Shouchella hunanensis TaxID=766894 RepID=A0ABY7WAR8_9BACI|nr:DsbA family protein [Shouchella hunanensis]WDF05544.1 DsbA family protein [Shouchella hunanensis]
MNNKGMSLVYVWDAYCGWCYGFSDSLKAFHASHPELKLTVLSGGLFIGSKKSSIGSYPHIPEANKRIHKLTGAEFGEKYEKLLEEGSFVLDSEAAARGLSALKYFAPDKAYKLASEMQIKFYVEGKSLSSEKTYLEIARNNSLDADAVINRFNSNISAKDAYNEFEQVQALGINSFPTLLLKKGDELIPLGGGVMTNEKLEIRLNEAM